MHKQPYFVIDKTVAKCICQLATVLLTLFRATIYVTETLLQHKYNYTFVLVRKAKKTYIKQNVNNVNVI